MSTKPTANRKIAPAKPQPPAVGDHSKRRRNRAIVSCLNCHTSKRMCDRKRPACARCIELGLTGTCEYEVDEPGTQNRSSMLIKKVAELEGAIMELKNSNRGRMSESSYTGQRNSAIDAWNMARPPSSAASTRSSVSSGFSGPHGSPSMYTTPATSPSVYGTDDASASAELTNVDLRSFLTSVPPFIEYEDNVEVHQQQFSSGMPATSSSPYHNTTQAVPPCNCMNDASNYQTMLELSLRLRKAVGILSQYPLHQVGGYCLLNQCLVEFDNLTAEILSTVEAPHLRPPSCNQMPVGAYPPSPTTSPHAFAHPSSRLDPWSSNGGPNVGNADSLMSWEPRRRS